MSNPEIAPPNPATLASASADHVLRHDRFESTPEDHEVLRFLDNGADSLGFIDQQYFVQTARSLSIPAFFDTDEEVRYGNFYRLAFEGVFKCYSKVMVGRVIGAKSVRALCLTFDDVTLLPYFDEIPDEHLLHVPALAVESIDQTG